MLRVLICSLLFAVACKGESPSSLEGPKAVPESPTRAPESPKDPVAPPPVDGALAAEVHKKFGGRCRLERSCGELLGIDCNAAVDGPYFYAQKSDLKIVSTCGGACMSGGCTQCPPAEWTCETY
jgi:hypothetical protein